VYRWVVERTISWFHQFRRLRVRYDRRDDIHQGLCDLAEVLITVPDRRITSLTR
jgi:transposase